jgi:phosphatidylglycerol:prolipoprotein diacylglycerol transferase
MYPTLFTIGDIYVSSFSIMVLIAFIVAYFVGESELKRKGLNSNLADLILIACVIGGLGGAKILFLYQQATFSELIADPVRYLASGFTFYGGFMGVLIVIWFVTQMKRVSYLKVLDSLTPGIILAYAVGRIGCLLVGDDYGTPSTLPWAISFPNGSPPTYLTVHPTQIYDTISMAIFFIILWKIRKKDFPIGWMTAVALMVLGVERFLIEFIRSTTPSFVPGLSQAQIISIILVVVGGVMLYKVGQREENRKESQVY